MTVRVVNMQGGAFGGGITPIVTSFSDDFNRANNASGFGPDWMWAGMSYTAALFGAIGPSGISVNQSVWQSQAANQNISVPVGYMPVPPLSGLFGISQFSEVQFISSNSTQGNQVFYAGPSVMCGWATAGGYRQYNLGCFVDDLQSILIVTKFDGTTLTSLLNLGAASVAPNDVIRIEARLNPGQVDLTVLRNSIITGTVSDAAADQIITGSPGLHRVQYVTAAAPILSTVIFDNYACGSL